MPDDSKLTHQQPAEPKGKVLGCKLPQCNDTPPEKKAAHIKNWNAQRPKAK